MSPFRSPLHRNPIMRGCPVCLREDAARATGPPHTAMVMRGDWQLREAMLCVRHCHPLVPLWQATSPRDRFDIGARLREIEAEILSGAFERTFRNPSAYDLWLDRRLRDGVDDTWLSDHPVYVVTIICRLLGQALLKGERREEGSVSDSAHSAGFDAVVIGMETLRVTLDKIAAGATGATDEPGKAFGSLYKSLSRDYLSEPGFDLFRRYTAPKSCPSGENGAIPRAARRLLRVFRC